MKNLLLFLLIILAGYGCDSTKGDMFEPTDVISTHAKKIEIISQNDNTYTLRADMPYPYNYDFLWSTDYDNYPDAYQERGIEVTITIRKDVSIAVFGYQESGIGVPLRSNIKKLSYQDGI